MRVLGLFILTLLVLSIESSHFFGGSITAKFVADQNTTSLLMEYQVRAGWKQSWNWGVPPGVCNTSAIIAGTVFLGSGVIRCNTSCFVGQTNIIPSIAAYCIAVNMVDGWSYGEIIKQVSVMKNAKYVEGNLNGNAWIGLNNLNTGLGYWELRTRIDTNFRSDINSYNSCPSTIMPPVLKLRLGIRQNFAIPYTDQDNDDVRCRYALASKFECADICTPISAVTLNVTACRMYFDGNLAAINPNNGWYAVPLMIEDFLTTSSTTSMCSVPLQFMIQVQNVISTCMTPPEMVGDWPEGSCIAANLNQQLNLRMVAQVGCTGVTISNIQILGPSVTFGSTVILVSGTTNQWSSNMTWTPKASQYGPNLVCGLATDSTYLISNLNCYTILAGVTIPYIIRGTGYPSGVLTAAQQAGVGGFITWSIKFNINPILKPVKRTYVRLFYANGTQIFKMDCSIFPSISYVNDTMYIVTGNNFVAGSYYWTFGYGVGTGPEFCHPETDTVTDPTFWTFTWVGPTTTILSTQTFPPGGTVGTSGASPTTAPILPLGLTTQSTTTTTVTTGTNTGVSSAGGSTTTNPSASITTAVGGATGITSTGSGGLFTNGSMINHNYNCISPFPTSTNCTLSSMAAIFSAFLIPSLVGHVSTFTGALMIYSKKRLLLINEDL